MIVCVCNRLNDATCRETAASGRCRTVGCMYRLNGHRVRMGNLHGADADASPGGRDDEAPRLVIELQRSFDLWERSWPDLPLAALWVQVGDDSEALARMLAVTLGQRVGVLDPAEALPGFEQAAPTPAVREAVLPIVGALLRQESRRL